MFDCLVESMLKYIGQTVTIFTESGGLSGAGFTGILACVDGCCVRLITDIGAPPACPIGSACLGGEAFTPYGNNFGGYGGVPFMGNWLGSVCEIPISQIVCFTHSAI